jgi:hypothetical protein
VRNASVSNNSIYVSTLTNEVFLAIGGDQLQLANGEYFPQSISVSGNTIVYEEVVARSVTLVDFSAIGLVFSGNSVSVKGTQTGEGITIVRITQNRGGIYSANTFNSRSQGIGTGFIVQGGSTDRSVSISGNSFSSMSRGIASAGSAVEYNITIKDNIDRGCNNASADFDTANAGGFAGGGGSKWAFKSTAPTAGTWVQGDRVYNKTGATGGWRCTASGTAGTLTGVTATTTAGSAEITLNSIAGVEEGQFVTISGVSGTKTIKSINYATRVVQLTSTVDATVAGATLSFVAPTFVTV